MAFNIGLTTEYDDANSILDPLVLSAAQAVNLGFNQGRFWQAMGAPSQAITQKVFEIYSRSLTSLSGVVGDGAATGWVDGVATTNLPMTAAGVNVLTVGTVMQVESEVVVVKSVNRTANTIDVFERGAGATTGAAHVDTTPYVVLSSAGNSTDLVNVESRTENTLLYTNYGQTMFETIDYTLEDEIIGRKALDPANYVTFMQEEAMKRVSAKLSSTAILGIKRQGIKTIPPMSAGLLEQLADTAGATRPVLSYNVSSAAFDEPKLKAALEEVFVRGNPDTIVLSQKNKNIMNTFNNSYIQTPRTDQAAGVTISRYEYEGKSLLVMVDSDMPDDKVAIVNLGLCKKGWLPADVMRFVDEPSTSSREKRGSLQGTFGIEIVDVGYEHIYMYGIV